MILAERTSVHASAVPVDVRETDPVVARIRPTGTAVEFEDARVWRVSPLGMELANCSALGFMPSIGNTVEVELVVAGRRALFFGSLVDVDHETDRLGIRFLTPDRVRVDHSDSRRGHRWTCADDFFPKAISAVPGRFNEFIGFRVRNISSGGLQLTTSLDNAFLVPGLDLTLTIALPFIGEVIVAAKIVRMRVDLEGSREILDVGVEISELDPPSKAMLGQYLVQYSRDTTIEQLREEGFVDRIEALGIKFRYLKTEAEYRELLELRRNESALERDWSKFVKAADRNCRIVLGYVGRELVVTCNVGYPDSKTTLEAEKLIEWTNDLPRRDQMIEVTEILTKGTVRDDQTSVALLQFLCTSCISPARPYVGILTDPGQRAFFDSAGWSEIPSDSTETSVMIADGYGAMVGRGVSLSRWSVIWQEPYEFLSNSGVLSLQGTDGIVLRLYRLLGPLHRRVHALWYRIFARSGNRG